MATYPGIWTSIGIAELKDATIECIGALNGDEIGPAGF